jgi:hypothetical protein
MTYRTTKGRMDAEKAETYANAKSKSQSERTLSRGSEEGGGRRDRR